MSLPSWPEWCCPVDRKPLKQHSDALTCHDGDHFLIRNNIPRFFSGNTYTDSFGAQWKRYRLTQLDSYTGTSITMDRVRNCLGEDLWQTLSGKQVLECGCGAGRFT